MAINFHLVLFNKTHMDEYIEYSVINNHRCATRHSQHNHCVLKDSNQRHLTLVFFL